MPLHPVELPAVPHIVVLTRFIERIEQSMRRTTSMFARCWDPFACSYLQLWLRTLFLGAA